MNIWGNKCDKRTARMAHRVKRRGHFLFVAYESELGLLRRRSHVVKLTTKLMWKRLNLEGGLAADSGRITHPLLLYSNLIVRHHLNIIDSQHPPSTDNFRRAPIDDRPKPFSNCSIPVCETSVSAMRCYTIFNVRLESEANFISHVHTKTYQN